MHTLVTGGAGFIGSHLVDALLDRGDSVAVLDDLSTGRPENLAAARARGARLHVGDVREADVLRDLIAAEQPEVIMHLAAQIDVRVSVDDPGADAATNLIGTINVLEAARLAGVGRVVFASTGGAIYGEAAVPTRESAALQPLSGYGQSKLSAEGYLGLYRRLHGLRTVALRLANVYGPRQRSDGEGGIVAIACGQVRRGEPVTIFGDGEQTRDYVYVGDVAHAFLAATGIEQPGPFNIGTGTQTSVTELVAMVRRLNPAAPVPVFADPRAGEVLHSCLDPGLAHRALGWRADTPLETGLARTYDEPRLRPLPQPRPVATAVPSR